MRTFAFLFPILFSTTAAAMSIDWAGIYRVEWTQIDRPSLGTPSQGKAYGLQSLSLSPKIIASDGVNIVSKFDVFNNQDADYSNHSFGEMWGRSLTKNGTDSNAVGSRAKTPVGLTVSQLYLNVNQEYGSFLVGRAPLHFGLGLSHNAGLSPWDHWVTVYDLVGYKFIVGNMYFMPAVSRVSVGDYGLGNTVQDEMFQLVYDSADSGSMIGVMFDRRRAAVASNDTPVGGADQVGRTGGTIADVPYSIQLVNFTLGRSWDSFRFKMEAGFLSGDYGVRDGVRGEFVKATGHGVAVEMEFPRPESKFDWSLRLGSASGDDPSTADIESFQFNRNYDVALLMFNHRLGAKDFLQTNTIKSSARTLANSLDDEAISNVAYISPRVKYAWSERWDVINSLTYAQLMTNPTNSVDFDKSLGLELDIELAYKPRSNVTWVNQLGLLFPGEAFKDGASNLDNGFTYGFVTKAAITF